MHRSSCLLIAALFVAGACRDSLTPGREGATGPADQVSISSTTAWPLQHGGLTVLSDRAFTSKARHALDLVGSEGWSTGEHRYPNMVIVQDASAPHSPTTGMDFRYPAGARGGSVGGAHFSLRGNRSHFRTAYTGFWVKLSSNFVGHRTGTQSITSYWIAGMPRVTMALQGTGTESLTPTILFMGRGDPRSRLGANQPGAPAIQRGVWQRWEVMLVANTPGEADGRVYWWIDGVPVAEYEDLRILGAGESDRWEWFYLEPTWGFAGIDVAPEGMSVRVDHARVAGSPERLSAGEAPPPPPPPPTPARIDIAPDGGQLVVGDTLRLRASVFGADDTPIADAAVQWSSAQPAVAMVIDGLVTALTSGEATIAAQIEGVRDEVRVVVTASTPPDDPPPDDPPSTSLPDTIFADGFESGVLSAWHDGVDPSKHRVVTDPALVRSGTSALEITYPQGGNGGYLNRFFMPGYDSVHVSYWILLPSNWQGGSYLVGLYGSRIDNQWSAFGKAGVCPNGTDFFTSFLYAEYGGNPGPTRFYSYHLDMPSGGGCFGASSGAGTQYVDPTALTRGTWQRVEFWVRANTPGQANGAQRFWINGVLRGEWTGLRFRETTDLRLNALQITAHHPFGAPQTQRIYLDDIVVTTGATSSGPSDPPPPPPPPAPVASVSLSPSSVTLEVGATQTFVASLRDALGSLLGGRAIAWSSSNPAVASVSGSGVVSALAAGTTTIRATSEGVSGTAAVTVTAPEPPPPPPPPTADCDGAAPWRCEPSGLTNLVSTHITSLAADGWYWQQKQSPGYARIVADAQAPLGSPVLELGYPAGFSSAGVSPGALRPPRTAFPDANGSRNYRQLYWGFTFKANAEWQNHGSNINKIAFAWLNNTIPFGWTWHWGAPGGKSISMFLGGRYYHFNTAEAIRVEPGRWYRIEIYVRPSSAAGRADGEFKLWVDGVLSANHVNITTPSGYISDAYFDPTWGGVGGTSKLRDDYFRISHTRLSAR